MSWKVHLPQTSDWVSADYSTDMRWRTNLVPTDEITVTSWQLYFPTDVRIEHAMIDSHVLETLGFHRRQNRLYQYSYALANPLAWQTNWNGRMGGLRTPQDSMERSLDKSSSNPCFHRDRKPAAVNSLSSSDSTVMSWKVHLPQTSDWVSADYSTDTRWRTNLVPTDAITITSWQLSVSHRRQDRTRDDRQSRLGNYRFL
ncbi:hypothetical protein F2Q69_00033482 [Brassica cretica]|uniref:Uncharacterized protein n=1 Tax=Brassica cretica TaxID=69181 RepID=A0A8S9SQY0_BRACR|nr:hypothetical protein F2Q69_00033482 [Brassica cretica]